MEYFLDLFRQDNPLWVTAFVAGIVIVSAIIALIFNKLIFPIFVRVANWLPTSLDSRILNATRLPLTFGLVLLSIYLSITNLVVLIPEQRAFIDRVSSLLVMVIGIWMIASVVSEVFRWYLDTISQRTKSNVDERIVPMIRRIAVLLIYVLGGLLILDQLHINISPLIAGLGLGGLAVALALQPTLSNLFAGTYVMTEGVVTPGDYIELETGVAGYVMDVSWRSTRLRTWHNNLVVVPNARFAETIITNYQEPAPAVNVFLTCGVSYDSDLWRVREVCQEVMDDLLENDPNAIKEYGNWFGFDSFGESNVNFWLFIQAKDRLASFALQTALMENLHQRFRGEGIVINYPVRSLQFPKEWGPDDVLGPNRGPVPSQVRHQPQRPRPEPRADTHVIPETDGGGDGPGGDGLGGGGPDL